MDRESEQRISLAAARGAASLSAGSTLDEVLRAFREDEHLGAIESMIALRTIEEINLGAAKQLVSAACSGERFPHLGLDELRHIARIPRLPTISSWLPTHLQGAIIDGRPWKLFLRGVPGSVRYFDAKAPDPARSGSMYGAGVSFDRVRDDARAAVLEPGWSDELRIVRDEPDLLLVHFQRVREAAATK
ncbi:MAG TPA: hypothetical protein VLX92_03560 [Kofleriaceae bacterium]|nr:hypothetical protein [Kofleriaceae bacterium]